MTLIAMFVLVVFLICITLCGVKYEQTKDSFMSIEDTTFLRGFWCIIVVLVHIPVEYQNKIQDIIGSFAFIGVTFFFMTSAYGLKYSIANKKDYMKYFWRKRLPPILIPALIANAFGVILRGFQGNDISFISFININAWVKVLLLYYFIFWVIYGVVPWIINKHSSSDNVNLEMYNTISRGGQDCIMCTIVLCFSLVDYFTTFKITSRWIVEPLGFAYGILAACYASRIRDWISKKWGIKSIILMFGSGVFGLTYLKFKPIVFWGDYLLKVGLGIVITAFIFTLIGKIKVGNKVNGFLGAISYEVYLLHGAVFVLLKMIDKKGMNSGIFVIFSIAITILLAYLLKLFCTFIQKYWVKKLIKS